MQTLFGLELSPALRWIIAFAVILVLLALLGLFVRRITGGRLRGAGQGGGRARQPRLGVVDIYDLDRQRQLVLIRRDNVEHLVMIGGVSDVVVETNIVRGAARVAAPPQAEIPSFDRPLAIDPGLGPEPLRPEAGDEPRRMPPPLQPQQPEPLPPLPHRAPSPAPAAAPAPAPTPAPPPAPAPAPRAEPSVAPAAAAAGLAGIAAGAAAAAVQAPNFGRSQAPAPSVSSSELDDMARQLEEALKRPFSAVRPAQAPAEAPPVPEVAKAPPPPPVVPPAAAPSEPKPQAAAPALGPVPAAPPPVFGRPVGVPPDVAAELEMALGLKPKAAEPAAPPPPPAAAPKPVAVQPAPQEQPKQAEPAPLVHKEPEPELEEPELAEKGAEEVKAQAEDETEAADEAEEKPAAEEAEEAPAESKREEKPVHIDPFSVDAIEAEFARLLGRDPKQKS